MSFWREELSQFLSGKAEYIKKWILFALKIHSNIESFVHVVVQMRIIIVRALHLIAVRVPQTSTKNTSTNTKSVTVKTQHSIVCLILKNPLIHIHLTSPTPESKTQQKKTPRSRMKLCGVVAWPSLSHTQNNIESTTKYSHSTCWLCCGRRAERSPTGRRRCRRSCEARCPTSRSSTGNS